MDCSVFQPICDSILGWWNDPWWTWLGWGLLIIAVLAVIHWLLFAARPLTGPGIIATIAAMIGYFFGRRDQKKKQQRTVQERTRQQERQWPNPFDWWSKK